MKGFLSESTAVNVVESNAKIGSPTRSHKISKTITPKSTPKTMIQTRLEKWERMSPSTVSISSRLNEATVRREMALAEITIRARLHCNEVNHTVTSLNNQKEQRVQALTENLDMKFNLASESKENIKREYSVKMQEKMEKISRARENNKASAAEVEEKIQKKMAAVDEHKENIKRQYSIKMQEKMEKISRAKNMDAATAAEIEEKAHKKMTIAEENKESLRREYSIKMQEKMEKISRAKNMDKEVAAEVEEKAQKKMTIAEENKESLRREYSAKMQEKMEKISRVKEMDKEIAAEVEEKAQKKMTIVNENKENIKREYSVKMQEKMEKISRAKHIDAATAAEIEEKAQKKMAIAEENKESLRREYSVKMQEKMEKISRVKEMDKETAAEIEEKSNAKIASAAERKSNIVAENVNKVASSLKKKRNRVEQNKFLEDMKVKDIQISHENKLECASARKMQVLSSVSSCTASSTKKGLERARLYRLAQDADISSLKKKLEDKMEGATGRKDEVITTITSKAAEENKNIIDRTKELINQREINVREMLCKHENKLEGANKRKERIAKEDFERKELANFRREKVLENVHIKDTVVLPKNKEQLESKLEEAAVRRCNLLMEKLPKSPVPKKTLPASYSYTPSPLRSKCLDRPATEETADVSNDDKECDKCAITNATGFVLDTLGFITNTFFGFLGKK